MRMHGEETEKKSGTCKWANITHLRRRIEKGGNRTGAISRMGEVEEVPGKMKTKELGEKQMARVAENDRYDEAREDQRKRTMRDNSGPSTKREMEKQKGGGPKSGLI